MFSVHDEEFVSHLPTAKDKHQVTNANMQGTGVILLKVLPISSRMRISTLGHECKTGGGKAASQVHGEQPDGNPASRFQPEVLAGCSHSQLAFETPITLLLRVLHLLLKCSAFSEPCCIKSALKSLSERQPCF